MTGGGTAGHITPLLAVAGELVSQANGELDIYFIGQKGDKNTTLVEQDDTEISIHLIRAGKFRRYHNERFLRRFLDIKTNLLNVRDALFVLIGFFQALSILGRIRPKAMFAKGGFVVVPVGWACRILKIPYITHDSDTMPGLANRIIARGAIKNAVAYSGTNNYSQHKTIVTGIPLSNEYEERRGKAQDPYKKLLNIPQDSVVLLVFAGTQGARVIDEALDRLIPDLLVKYPKLYVVHVFGRLNEGTLKSQYATVSLDQNSRIKKLAFIDNAYDYIAAADIIIGRAGATSIAEFATVGRATIIIPADHLSAGHQLKNAEYLDVADAACIVRESKIDSSLAGVLNELIHDKSKRNLLASNISKLATPKASSVIAKELLAVALGTK